MKKAAFVVCMSLVATLMACGGGENKENNPVRQLIADTPDANLADADHVQAAAQNGHPYQAISNGAMLGVTMLVLHTFNEEGENEIQCPTIIDNSVDENTDITVIGDGCVTDEGTVILGELTITGGENEFVFDYSDFSFNNTVECANGETGQFKWVTNGLVAMSPAEGVGALDLHWDLLYSTKLVFVDEATCDEYSLTMAADYQVSQIYSGEDFNDDGTPDEFVTFDGSGTQAVIGQIPDANGAIQDVKLRFDSSAQTLRHGNIDVLPSGEDCTEALDGGMTIQAGGRTATVAADGLSKCTAEACAPYQLDGVDQGEVCGVAGCSIAPNAKRGPLWLVLPLIGLGFVVFRRFRVQY